MDTVKHTDDTKCWQGWGATGTRVHCWWERGTGQPLWKAVWQFHKKLHVQQPSDPGLLLLVFLINFIYVFIYLFLAALGLPCCAWAFL